MPAGGSNMTGAQQLAAGGRGVSGAVRDSVNRSRVRRSARLDRTWKADDTNPLNVYGVSKRAAEEWILALFPDALIVRTAAFFGPLDQYGFLTRALREVSAGREVVAAEDVVISPTYLPHLADAMLDLLIDRERGIWHLANRGMVSWADFATLAAQIAGLDGSLVRRVRLAELGLSARRPPFSALESERGNIMPALELGVRDYLASSVQLDGESVGSSPQVALNRI